MLELPNKKYSIIYADPPWDIGYAKETKCGIGSYDLPYSTMSDDEIMALPVKDILEDNSILFMWIIDSRIPKIKELMESWGFNYITVGFVWNKKAIFTNGNNAILSRYTRKSCEFCFIGRKGKMLVKDANVDQFISEPKREHSRKPKGIRSSIVKMCGDLPRIELFSRDKIEGWDCWGNEVPTSEQRLLGGV
jgi:N6-adenosine-specific RNA methylase IME4